MTRDEEEVITRCIDSISPYVKEIILLDTGSNDNTIELALSKNVIVKEVQWNKDFASIRNAMISFASQPVILMIDADEFVEPDQGTFFEKSYIEIMKNHKLVGKINIINETEPGEFTNSCIARLFRKSSDLFYEGAIHEQLCSKTGALSYFNTEIHFSHIGYNKERLKHKDKIRRNLDILLNELGRRDQDAYLNFQVGRTYFVADKHHDAEQYLETAYRVAGGDETFHSTLVQTYGWVLLKNRRFTVLFDLLYSMIDKYTEYTDLYFLYGCALIELRSAEHIQLIPEAFQTCINLGEADLEKYETVTGVGTFKAYYNLGVYYEVIGKMEHAIEAYRNSSKYNYKPAIDRLNKL